MVATVYGVDPTADQGPFRLDPAATDQWRNTFGVTDTGGGNVGSIASDGIGGFGPTAPSSSSSSSGGIVDTINGWNSTLSSLDPTSPTFKGVGNLLNTVTGGALGGSGSSSNWPAIIAEYFIRGVIIILGFIFIAEGLHLFAGTPSVVEKLKP